LETWDSRYPSRLEGLGYLSPLSQVLCAAIQSASPTIQSEFVVYDHNLLYSLFTNQNAESYTIDQLNQFLTDMETFSADFHANKSQEVEKLQNLGKELVEEKSLINTKLFSYRLVNGYNQHLMGALSSRAHSWLKLKNTPQHDLLTAIT